MKERELCGLLKKSCADEGLMYVDIPDGMGMVGSPCDGILNYHGKFIAIEAKRHTKHKAFNPNELRENQIRGLNASAASGGESYVILFIWEARKHHKMLWWEWNEFKELTNNLTTSIKKKDIEERRYINCVKKRYQLADFFTELDEKIL